MPLGHATVTPTLVADATVQATTQIATDAAVRGSDDTDAAVRELESKGFATLPVAAYTSATVAHGFGVARLAFDALEDGPPQLGSHTTDSANASGAHRVGALSTYNACREGFVFSNGATFRVNGVDGFEPAMGAFFAAALAVAHGVLGALSC